MSEPVLQTPPIDARTVAPAETFDATRRLETIISDARAWTRRDLAPDSWRRPLPNEVIEEVTAHLASIPDGPGVGAMTRVDPRSVPRAAAFMSQVARTLDDGIGMCVLSALPLDQLGELPGKRVYWVLGQLLARPVPTKWDGTMMYDVRDTGRAMAYGVRGSTTNLELSFHTDNAFGIALPDYVGLLCIRPAAEGGLSRFCSLYSVHNRMLLHHPQLLERLYQPAYFDRQAEHHAEQPRLLMAPIFSWGPRGLTARLTPNLVRRGYQMAGVPIDARLEDAMIAMEQFMHDSDLWIEFRLNRGQMQFVNNRWAAHYRSAFVDSDPQHGRHLVRVWYRDSGGPGYHGDEGST